MSKRTLNKQDIADAFGVSAQTVGRWCRDHDCPCDKSGPRGAYRFALSEVNEWAAETGRIEIDDDDDPEKAADLKWKQERARLKELDRLEREGELHNVTECQTRKVKAVHAVKSALMSLPRSIAQELEGRERQEIEDILEERMRRICNQFSGEYGE